MSRFFLFSLPWVIAAAGLGCASKRADVRAEIDSADLSIVGFELGGTVHVLYENVGDEHLTVSKPELQVQAEDGSVRAVDLVFPADFDPSFDPGADAETTLTVDGGKSWQPFCDVPIELQMNHFSKRDSGSTIVSLGPAFKVTLPCE